jgi:hypothetical protein
VTVTNSAETVPVVNRVALSPAAAPPDNDHGGVGKRRRKGRP